MNAYLELENVLQFILKKNLEIIFDDISNDFSIERDKLDKYILQPIKNNDSDLNKTNTSPKIAICQGKTKKGDACPNKAKPNTNFCGKHSS
jgi:hypothetical protein